MNEWMNGILTGSYTWFWAKTTLQSPVGLWWSEHNLPVRDLSNVCVKGEPSPPSQ